MKHIAIIGAGSAGLAAATKLLQAGLAVTLYEQTCSVGGRNATNYVEGCVIDHGVQCLKTPSVELLNLIAACRDTGGTPAFDIPAPVWIFDAAGRVAEGDPAQNAEAKWSWREGIHTLSQAMASGLDIRFEMSIQSIIPDGHTYTLVDPSGATVGQADAILLTAPAPQTAEVIAASRLDASIRQAILDELTLVHYRRSLAVTLAYARRPAVPWYALVNIDRQHAITWLACEHVKPGHAPDGMGLMIAQMAHDYSVAHWDSVPDGLYGTYGIAMPSVLTEVDTLVQSLLPDKPGGPMWAYVRRWRYALPDGSANFERLNRLDSGMFFAGDFVTGQGRVHLAIESGWRVAEIITEIV